MSLAPANVFEIASSGFQFAFSSSLFTIISFVSFNVIMIAMVQHTKGHIQGTTIVLTELLKAIISIFFEYCSGKSFTETLDLVTSDLVHSDQMTEISKPALIYSIQYSITAIALAGLDAVTYRVLYQLRLFFSVFIRGSAKVIELASTILLFMGTSLVLAKTSNSGSHGAKKPFIPMLSPFIEMALTVFMAYLSPLSGAMLKNYIDPLHGNGPKNVGGTESGQPSLWRSNVQMSMLSALFSLIIVCLHSGAEIFSAGYFSGYNYKTLILIVIQACFGLLATYVVKKADVHCKMYATSIGLVANSLLSTIYFGSVQPSIALFAGVIFVVASSLLFVNESNPKVTTFFLYYLSCSPKTELTFTALAQQAFNQARLSVFRLSDKLSRKLQE
jgi:hypothetical protein